MKMNNSMMRHRVRAAPFLLFTLAVLAACGGDNLFTPPTEKPEVTNLTLASDTVVEGGTLSVSVQATATRVISQLNLRLRGATTADTLITLDEPGTSLAGTFSLPVPFNTGPDSLLTVEAIAINAAGTAGDPAVDTAFVVDATPPDVEATVDPLVLGTGEFMDVDVTASDNRGLSVVGVFLTDGAGFEMTVDSVLSPSQLAFDHTFRIAAPNIDVGTLEVYAFAQDVNTLPQTSASFDVELTDRLGPVFQSITTDPDSTVPLGDSVRVEVSLSDPTGIRSVTFVGFAIRGDPAFGTDTLVTRYDAQTVVFPRTQADTLFETLTLQRYLTTPDDTTAEPVQIVVIAEDSLGNVSEITTDIYVGGPSVKMIFPPPGDTFKVGVGDQFDVRVQVVDPQGLDSAKLVLQGGLNQTFDLALPSNTTDTLSLTRTLTMPGSETVFTMQGYAWNATPQTVAGSTRPVVVQVLGAPPADTLEPTVSLHVDPVSTPTDFPRLEWTDTFRIVVTARDNGLAGLERIGFRAIATRGTVQDTIDVDWTFSPRSISEESDTFAVAIDELYSFFGITGDAALDAITPDTVSLDIHAFAVDTMGAVACASGLNQQRTCNPASGGPSTFFEVADTSGFRTRLVAVRGETVLLDNTAALIADLAVDTVDDRVFLSNISQNLVELLDLDDDPRQIQFLPPVQVGSEPWGVFIGERVVDASDQAFIGGLAAAGDTARTLIVGNSGGTNMSLVHLDGTASNVQEVDVVRLSTPNAVLYEIQENLDEFGNTRYLVEYFDFSDRPQFLAQDSLLRIVYSTVATAAAPTATVRFVAGDPDPTGSTDDPEVRFLLTDDMVDSDAATSVVLANVDSIKFKVVASGSDSVRLFMHEPGYPDRVIFNQQLQPQISNAVDSMIVKMDSIMTAWGVPEQAPMFYPFYRRGAWDFGALSVTDTTFVSASGDRGKIVIGEGASAPTGRIIMWHASSRAVLSDEVEITDLVNNASEEVLGVGLNWDGSLGVARGRDATYFFTPDLRLQGLYQNGNAGGAGAVFHPDHDSPFDGGHTDTDGAGAAFTGTPDHSIEVVNTFHFNRINELFIRDNVVGPLKAGPPLASDNGGFGRSCPNATITSANDCVVAKLYGITNVGGVVVINVRSGDLP